MVGKPFYETKFSYEEYLQLSKVFNEKSILDIESTIKGFISEMVIRYYENNKDVLEYLCSETNNIAVCIDTAKQYGKWENIFVA